MTKPIIEKLDSSHDLDDFDCNSEPLNQYLKKFALVNQNSDSAKTYVALQNNTVIGYYTLAVGSVIHADSPIRIKKGLAQHPIPVMLLARLAVKNSHHGKGVGSGLLKDALLRTINASDIVGIRCLLVHAKDEPAKHWYKRFDFIESPTDSFHLFLLLKDIRSIMK